VNIYGGHLISANINIATEKENKSIRDAPLSTEKEKAIHSRCSRCFTVDGWEVAVWRLYLVS
jgi:hypothetical protein